MGTENRTLCIDYLWENKLIVANTMFTKDASQMVTYREKQLQMKSVI